MNVPVVLGPEASRDATDARDYYDSQRVGLGQVFLDRMNEALARSAPCHKSMASSGKMCARPDYESFPMSFTTEFTTTESKYWR